MSDIPRFCECNSTTRYGVKYETVNWIDETHYSILASCGSCGLEAPVVMWWHSRGIRIKRHGDFFELIRCCVYTGKTSAFSGLFVKELPDEASELEGKYDQESAMKFDALLHRYRKEGLGFFHTDAISIRELAITAIGRP